MGLLLIAAAPLSGQAAADPADVASIDAIIEAYYEVVSGPAGGVPDIERDRTLHTDDARVGIVGRDADGNATRFSGTLEDYYDRSGRGPRSAPFYETEIHRVVQRFGGIAQVWSTYAYRAAPEGPVTGRGINSIQLYHDGARWWITGWSFDSERDGNPIPAEYLPTGSGGGGASR